MPSLIRFVWEKCPDGYTVETLKKEFIDFDQRASTGVARPSNQAPPWVQELGVIKLNLMEQDYLIPKSNRLVKFEPLNSDSAMFMEFADCADSVANLIRFVDSYGLPCSYGRVLFNQHYGRVLFNQHYAKWMFDAVKCWKEAQLSNDYSQLTHSFNTATKFEVGNDDYDEDEEGTLRVHVELRHHPGGNGPSLSVVPNDLADAMWLEFAQAVSLNTLLQRCAACPTWFAYGTGTGRRKSAHYCSDRCRKSAWKPKQKGKRKGQGK